MFRRFYRGDVAGKAISITTPIFSRFTENPPIITISGTLVLVSLRLNAFEYPLINRRELPLYLVGG